MRTTPEPLIIQKLGVSGKVKDTYFGIMKQGKPEIIKNIDNLDELMQIINSKNT
jgi:hypothetical protein